MEVWRLAVGDEEVLRTVRLAALADAPSAFGSTLAREASFGVEDWSRRLDPPGATFVVAPAVGSPPVGMAWGAPDGAEPALAHLYGMWVAPSARGTGAADVLVRAVVGWAVERGAERLELTVVEGNGRAEGLYRRHGFGRTGGGERRTRDGVTEVPMVVRLLGATGAPANDRPAPEALAAFGIEAAGPVVGVPGGTLHRTWRVTTATGDVAVKVLADGGHPAWLADIGRAVAFEEAVWAAGTVSMAEPLATPDGSTWARVAGTAVRAHRWVLGAAGTEVAPTADRLWHLGRTVAAIVAVGAPAGTTAESLERNALDAFDATVTEARAVGAPFAAALAGLGEEVDRLRGAMGALAADGRRMVMGHGDLHPRNSVVVDGRDVLVDWDEAAPVVPVSQLLDAALAFAGGPRAATETLVAAARDGWSDAGGGPADLDGASTAILNAGLRTVLFHAWRALGHRGVDAAARSASARLVGPLAARWAADAPALRAWETRLEGGR